MRQAHHPKVGPPSSSTGVTLYQTSSGGLDTAAWVAGMQHYRTLQQITLLALLVEVEIPNPDDGPAGYVRRQLLAVRNSTAVQMLQMLFHRLPGQFQPRLAMQPEELLLFSLRLARI